MYIVSNLKTFGIDKKVLNANDININALTSIKKMEQVVVLLLQHQ